MRSTEDDCPSIIAGKSAKNTFSGDLGMFAQRDRNGSKTKKKVTEKRTLSYRFAFIIEKQQERKI